MGKTMIDSSLLPTNLDSMIRRVPVADGAQFQVPVAAGSVLRQLAEELFLAIQQMTVRDLQITEEDVMEAFEYLLAARCAYVSNLVKLEDHPKDIEYPTLLFPVLAAVGRYVDANLNLELIPIPEIGYQDALSETEDDEGRKLIVPNRKVRLRKPEKFSRVMATFRAYGVSTSMGLPMDKDVESDDLYRLNEVEDVIMGGSVEPSSHILYVRALLEMQYLACLYGETRVSYLALSSLKAGIYDLVARHVRGPSRRIDASRE